MNNVIDIPGESYGSSRVGPAMNRILLCTNKTATSQGGKRAGMKSADWAELDDAIPHGLYSK